MTKSKIIVISAVVAAVLAIFLSKVDILHSNEESILNNYCIAQEYSIQNDTIPASIVTDKAGVKRIVVKAKDMTIDMPLVIPGK